MDFIKLDSNFSQDQLKEMFSNLLYAQTNADSLCVAAKKTKFGDIQDQDTELPWTANTLIRIEKSQSAVFAIGDKVIASRAKAGDYAVQGEEELSSAKVYYIATDEKSGKLFNSHSPLVYCAVDKARGVSCDIALKCSYYFIYRIKNPKIFMKYVLGCKAKTLSRQSLESEMNAVFSVCLPELFSLLSAEEVSYNDTQAFSKRAADFMREKLSLAWKSSGGIELKDFVFVALDPNREDEKRFQKTCSEEKSGFSFDTNQFSEEFGSLMKGLANTAGDALADLGKELADIFGEFSENLENKINSETDENSDESEVFGDFDLDSIFGGSVTEVMGTWECAALGQRVSFELLYAVIENNGQQVWMGDWEEKEQEDKTKIVVCPTADGLGCYKYFEYHKDESSEYLAGVFFAEDGEKQFVRFERKKSE